MHVKEKRPQMFLAVTKWHYNGQFAVMIHKIFTWEEMHVKDKCPQMFLAVTKWHYNCQFAVMI